MNSEYLEAKERKKPVVDLKLGMLGWGRPRCRCPGTWHTVYKQLAVTQWLVCIYHHKPPFTEYSACVQLVRAWQLLNRLLRHESVADSERH